MLLNLIITKDLDYQTFPGDNCNLNSRYLYLVSARWVSRDAVGDVIHHAYDFHHFGIKQDD
jgi:hypothetical protein